MPLSTATLPSLTIDSLGQAGFRLSDGRATVVIDPYLSDSVGGLEGFPPGFWTRAYPPPVSPDELRDVELVLCSHDHLDHADPETLLGISRASPHCRFAGPHRTIALLRQIGLPTERTVALDAEVPFAWAGGVIDPVAAAHEAYETDAGGHHVFLGFLLRWSGATFYHAGDTVVTPELSARLMRERIDVAFLPVNGGDDPRRALGVVGNMEVADAAALAAGQGFRLVVPMHCDLYPRNGRSNESIAAIWQANAAARAVPLKFFRPGERWEWSRTRP